jgi:hypothetical protein
MELHYRALPRARAQPQAHFRRGGPEVPGTEAAYLQENLDWRVGGHDFGGRSRDIPAVAEELRCD